MHLIIKYFFINKQKGEGSVRKLILILVIFSSSLLHSEPAGNVIETKALMHYFFGALLNMKPFMTSFEEFKKPANSEKIRKELNLLKDKIVIEPPSQLVNSTGFNFSYNLMARHVGEIVHLYDFKIYAQAWEKLNATTSFCIGCHTRLPEKVNNVINQWSKLELVKGSSKTLADAEFLFLSHQYSSAIEFYDFKIRSFDSKTEEKTELLKMYERKLTFFARVLRDPKAAIESLKRDLKNTKLPKQIQDAIKAWIENFRDLEKISTDSLKNAKEIIKQNSSDKKIDLFDPTLIKLLFASGIIYERIFKITKSDESADLLYLLSLVERQLAPIRYYSLSDIYLYECVSQFPKSTIAKSCFKDYELSMKLKYGGTVPEFINISIESLRKLVGP